MDYNTTNILLLQKALTILVFFKNKTLIFFGNGSIQNKWLLQDRLKYFEAIKILFLIKAVLTK